MTPARAIDTQRLSTVAHEHERQIVRFFHNLTGLEGAVECIRQQAEKDAFQEVRVDSDGIFLARIGSGEHVIVMDGRGDPAGIAGMVYAGKLIDELGMYDDFTLWVAASLRQDLAGTVSLHTLKERGIHPECMLIAEPTNLCIRIREAAPEGFLSESHPLVEAAIATYETLFELPPIVSPSPSPNGPLGVPAIAFGPGEEQAPVRHLLKAAQYYAAFPTMYVDAVSLR
jgi:hypothetical protein